MNYQRIRLITEHYPLMQGLGIGIAGCFYLLLSLYYKYFSPWGQLDAIGMLVFIGSIMGASYGSLWAASYYQRKFGTVKNDKLTVFSIVSTFSFLPAILLGLMFDKLLRPPFSMPLLIFSAGAVLCWYFLWRKFSWHPLGFAVFFIILSVLMPPPPSPPKPPYDTPEAQNYLINMFVIASGATIFYGLIGHLMLIKCTRYFSREEEKDESVQRVI